MDPIQSPVTPDFEADRVEVPQGSRPENVEEPLSAQDVQDNQSFTQEVRERTNARNESLNQTLQSELVNGDISPERQQELIAQQAETFTQQSSALMTLTNAEGNRALAGTFLDSAKQYVEGKHGQGDLFSEGDPLAAVDALEERVGKVGDIFAEIYLQQLLEQTQGGELTPEIVQDFLNLNFDLEIESLPQFSTIDELKQVLKGSLPLENLLQVMAAEKIGEAIRELQPDSSEDGESISEEDLEETSDESAQSTQEQTPESKKQKSKKLWQKLLIFVAKHPDNSLDDFIGAVFGKQTYSRRSGFGIEGLGGEDQEGRLSESQITKALGTAGNYDTRAGFYQAVISESLKKMNPYNDDEKITIEAQLRSLESSPKSAVDYFASKDGSLLFAKLFEGKAIETSLHYVSKWLGGNMPQYSLPLEKVPNLPEGYPYGFTTKTLESMLKHLKS